MLLTKTSKFITVLLLTVSTLLSQNQREIPRLKILHPQQDMQFWVDDIEVAGDIPKGTSVSVNGQTVSPDEDGRFRHMVHLENAVEYIYIKEIRGERERQDTLRVFHRNPDHMTLDSVFVNNNIPSELDIHFVYPESGKFWASQVGLRGRTHPDAKLQMNGEDVTVYPSGAYTVHVDVRPGDNHFDFEAQLKGSTISRRLTLSRPEKKAPKGKLLQETAYPQELLWVMAGDFLRAEIQGEPGQKVEFKVPGYSHWTELQEIAPGRYAGGLFLRDIEKELETQILYRSSLLSKRLKSDEVHILTKPRGGLSHSDDTRVYDDASTDQLLFPLEDSVAFQIVGLENKMYRIMLGDTRRAYVRASHVSLNPQARLTVPQYLGPLRSENKNDWSVFRIHTGGKRLPFEIKEKGVPARLELKVYGAKQGWEWTTYPDDDSSLMLLERSQPENAVWQMDFFPKTQFWGWYGRYAGDFLEIGIRKAPTLNSDSLFANVRIEIDPGHGGWERGALGITGYAEADANLRYCLKLEEMLKAAGATVFMTRRDDRQVSLAKRAEIARNDSVHIFVMAHNNAPGVTTDLLTVSGASTFYTWPSSKRLSDAIYPHLGDMGIATSGKVNRYYYYLTRQTEYLVYLIEGAFMTYPDEEMFLLSEEGIETLAKAAFLGLEDFLKEQAEMQLIRKK